MKEIKILDHITNNHSVPPKTHLAAKQTKIKKNQNLFRNLIKSKFKVEIENILLAKFEADHVLNLFKVYITTQVITKEQKRFAIMLLQEKAVEAERSFTMNLDESIHPQNYWSSAEGTIASSSDSESSVMDTSSDNEAEAAENAAEEQEAPLQHEGGGEDLPHSCGNSKFIKCVVATINYLTDARNISNPTPAKWSIWPDYRKGVFFNVMMALGVSHDSIKAWILDAPNNGPGTLEELQDELAAIQEAMQGAGQAAMQADQ